MSGIIELPPKRKRKKALDELEPLLSKVDREVDPERREEDLKAFEAAMAKRPLSPPSRAPIPEVPQGAGAVALERDRRLGILGDEIRIDGSGMRRTSNRQTPTKPALRKEDTTRAAQRTPARFPDGENS